MDGAPSEGCSTTTVLAQLFIERDAGAGAVHTITLSVSLPFSDFSRNHRWTAPVIEKEGFCKVMVTMCGPGRSNLRMWMLLRTSPIRRLSDSIVTDGSELIRCEGRQDFSMSMID
jgi:hypothetical protein